jgi:Asp-tRNA(Asn)/Glu-tRNA(Gln) amidotransferase A subunit family amidase
MITARLLPQRNSAEEVERRLSAITAGRSLNAIISINPHVKSEAQRCDRAWRSGTKIGPLHGIPLVVKDNIDCVGLATTLGCRALAEAQPREDARVIARLKAAGALILAKANLSEFAFDVRSRSSIGGDVRNPLNPQLTAGGSSGGSAAAVVAGMADAALGSDTGGSIRIPAAWTGLVGLRPAFRRSQLRGVAPLSLSKDTVGPMTWCVADAALLHQVMHALPPRSLTPRGLRGVRLGIVSDLLGDDAPQRQTLAQAFAHLRRAGVTLVPLRLPLAQRVADEPCLSLHEFHPAMASWLTKMDHAPGSLSALLSRGEHLTEFDALLQSHLTRKVLVCEAWREQRRFQRHLRQQLHLQLQEQRLDALIYPTSQRMPVSLDKMPPGWAPELAAISGLPAVTLPFGQMANGLPLGLELLYPTPDEEALLALALAVERLR